MGHRAQGHPYRWHRYPTSARHGPACAEDISIDRANIWRVPGIGSHDLRTYGYKLVGGQVFYDLIFFVHGPPWAHDLFFFGLRPKK